MNLLRKTSPLSEESREETFAETSYYNEDGLRKVVPYYFTHNTFAKRRWIGKILFDILKEEYTLGSDDYIRLMADHGRFSLNMKPVNAEDLESIRIKDGDLFSSKMHRHEPPITSENVKIIEENDKGMCSDGYGWVEIFVALIDPLCLIRT